MKPKLKTIFPIATFLLLIAAIALWNLIRPVKVFSENENRLLAQFPSFTAETVRDGSFTEGYEEYLADQFPVRDGWISLKTRTELLSGRREINNVFIGKGNWLIDKYDGTLSQERIDGNLKLLGDFTTYAAQTLGQDHVRVLLVPTASAVLTDKLPPFAHDFDQQALLDEAASLCPEGTVLNLLPLLQEKQSEYLYYRTDHHWTTLGAYYGYNAWAESVGLTPWSRDSFTEDTVTESFYGTTYSKINLPVTPDSIVRFTPKDNVSYHMTINLGEKESDSLYAPEYLEKKDKYSYFLGGNNPIVEITSSAGEPGRKLLIVKDSYSHCFAPFAANHFEMTTLLDLRYFNMGVRQYMEENGITDVLVLYSTANFADDRYLSTLSR